jgi:YVTN family beta-propeller protein
MRNPGLLASGLVAAFLSVSCANGFARDTGLIFVGSELTDRLIVIDPETNRIVKQLITSRRPRDMHFNDDHNKLYVACGDDDTVDVIDVAKLEVVDRLATASGPAALRSMTGGAASMQ